MHDLRKEELFNTNFRSDKDETNDHSDKMDYLERANNSESKNSKKMENVYSGSVNYQKKHRKSL